MRFLIDDYIARMTERLWKRLVDEENFVLINKLRRVENKEPGFNTFIIPTEGFSQNKITHNMVIKWLEIKKVNVYDPKIEIKELEKALEEK